MKLKHIQSQSRSLPTKEVYPPVIIVASIVTSDLIVHIFVLKSLRSRSKNPRKQNQTPRHIMLLSISGHVPRDLFILAVNMVSLDTTNPNASRQSPVSPRVS
jgi:hypothetical protein